MPEPELLKSGVASLRLESEGLDVTVSVSSVLVPALLLSDGEVSVCC